MTCENGDVAVPAARTPLTFFAIEANQELKTYLLISFPIETKQLQKLTKVVN